MIGYMRTHVRKQPIIALYFEFETALKFYNPEACFWFQFQIKQFLYRNLTVSIVIDTKVRKRTKIRNRYNQVPNHTEKGEKKTHISTCLSILFYQVWKIQICTTTRQTNGQMEITICTHPSDWLIGDTLNAVISSLSQRIQGETHTNHYESFFQIS